MHTYYLQFDDGNIEALTLQRLEGYKDEGRLFDYDLRFIILKKREELKSFDFREQIPQSAKLYTEAKEKILL